MDLKRLLNTPVDLPMVLQDKITPDRLLEVLGSKPRRFRLNDYKQPLKEPFVTRPDQKDWNLMFPFYETFVPAFEFMCEVEHIPFAPKDKSKGVAYTFLKSPTEEQIEAVRRWINLVGPFVAMRDCLAVSFALDYDCVDGDPGKPKTEVGQIRYQAKPYGRSVTEANRRAASRLSERLVHALEALTVYSLADCVVGMPSSKAQVDFSLSGYLASEVAVACRIENLSDRVRTVRDRPAIKTVARDAKISTLTGTIGLDDQAFKDRNVLVLDDLYQSGASINYLGMLLLEAGAKQILGLACEKTCRNDDNLLHRQ